MTWLRAHRHEAAISTITVGELLTGLAFATRNTSDLVGMGVELINPWDAY